MINHITLLVKDIERSKKFYTHALKPLGYKLLIENSERFNGKTAGYGIDDREGVRDFWIKQDASIQPPHSFTCFAFTAYNKQQVDDFYTHALAAGGIDNGAPGYRPQYHPGYYAAFVHDPDGYNIEVVFDDPAPKK